MAKRFSMREMGLLTAPVLTVGTVVLWPSFHQQFGQAKISDDRPRLIFQIDKPTALEAFNGAEAALVVALKQRTNKYRITGSSKVRLELQTAAGPVVLRQGVARKNWGSVWLGNSNGTRFPIRLSDIPDGALSFGCTSNIDFDDSSRNVLGSSKDTFYLTGQWKIERRQIQSPNLAAWPRKPLISLREVKISHIDSGPQFATRIIDGEATFRFDDAMKSKNPNLEIKLFSPDAELWHGKYVDWATISKKPSSRVAKWTIYWLKTSKSVVRIIGRVSADNRWPLGFQIEPFDFKTAKVGQKLKFKQFPVALPKS